MRRYVCLVFFNPPSGLRISPISMARSYPSGSISLLSLLFPQSALRLPLTLFCTLAFFPFCLVIVFSTIFFPFTSPEIGVQLLGCSDPDPITCIGVPDSTHLSKNRATVHGSHVSIFIVFAMLCPFLVQILTILLFFGLLLVRPPFY